MAYTEAQAITEVRYIINEETPSYWSDTELQGWIQQGVLDWCQKSLLFTREDSITLVSGQTEYTVSNLTYLASALRTIHAEYNGKALQRINYEQIRKHNAKSLGTDKTPVYFFDMYDGVNMTLYIGPAPSATEAGNDVTIHVAGKTTDITKIPDEYQPTIFLFAAHKAKFKERQYQEAYLYYQMYINNIVFSRSDALNRGIQTVDAFRIR